MPGITALLQGYLDDTPFAAAEMAELIAEQVRKERERERRLCSSRIVKKKKGMEEEITESRTIKMTIKMTMTITNKQASKQASSIHLVYSLFPFFPPPSLSLSASSASHRLRDQDRRGRRAAVRGFRDRHAPARLESGSPGETRGDYKRGKKTERESSLS